MGVRQVLEQIRQRHLTRQDSLDDEGWKTIKGTHVLIDETGEMAGGPQKLKDWHSSKKANGEGEPGKPKGPKVSDCKNGKELRQHLKTHYGMEMTGPCASWMNKPEVFPIMVEVFTSYEKFIEKIPELKGLPKTLRLSANGVMSTQGTELTFNQKYFTSMEDFEKLCKKMSDAHHWPPNTTIQSVVAHEFGHMIEGLLIKKEMAGESKAKQAIAWNGCHKSYSVVKGAKEDLENHGETIPSLYHIQKSISKYATGSFSETLAESFADVVANGKNANPYSRQIVRIALKRLRA